jgi:crotonobetainyl-CoA:carnitine CoA-transferase CaiB-like acyl-CoA transferase
MFSCAGGLAGPAMSAGADVCDEGSARRYAQALLRSLDCDAAIDAPVAGVAEHPALTWARSGLMALTGLPQGAPQMCPAPLAACADGALLALAQLASPGALAGLRGSALLTERAAIAGLTRNGEVSPGGACHLLRTSDGRIAVSLARDEDWALLPAWLERDGFAAGDWGELQRELRTRSLHDLVERGRLLGLAVAPSVPTPARAVPWFTRIGVAPAPSAPRRRAPRVVDLSSLWAGPLCSHLLLQLGADVVKVESVQRPDGARRGPADFFDLMHAGKRSVALDLAQPQERQRLRALIASADIVIEGSRPRALRQLGLVAEQLVAEYPQLTWISLTGYGRGAPATRRREAWVRERAQGPAGAPDGEDTRFASTPPLVEESMAGPTEQWAAFGDDAAVGAGLSYLLRRTSGLALMVGDAIADPLTGLHAALAAWAGYQRGGAGLISIALCDVVRHCLQFEALPTVEATRERAHAWTELVAGSGEQVALPQARQPAGAAPALGADTEAVFASWNLSC